VFVQYIYFFLVTEDTKDLFLLASKPHLEASLELYSGAFTIKLKDHSAQLVVMS